MAEHERWILAPAGPAIIESCWMCGIRLPARQLVADGSGACTDVRWYCLDVRGCTERWTARTAKPASNRQDSLPAAGQRDAGLTAESTQLTAKSA